MALRHTVAAAKNVLIDRMDHVKLVNFGSACRRNASASVANIPVGILDYLCPEVLMRLQQSPDGQGYFGEESDWCWSASVLMRCCMDVLQALCVCGRHLLKHNESQGLFDVSKQQRSSVCGKTDPFTADGIRESFGLQWDSRSSVLYWC